MKYPVLEVTEATSPQDIFDAVARHLLAQGMQAEVLVDLPHAVDSKPMCRYRAGELACAVGCLLTDDEAARNEGNLANGLVGVRSAIGRNWALLMDLQHVHDGSAPSEWRAELADFAERWGLSPAVLGEAQ